MAIKNPKATFTKNKGQTYMHLQFERMAADGLNRYTFPLILLDSMEMTIDKEKEMIENPNISIIYNEVAKVEFILEPNEREEFMTIQTIEREMTLKEIEEILGFKVKLQPEKTISDAAENIRKKFEMYNRSKQGPRDAAENIRKRVEMYNRSKQDPRD